MSINALLEQMTNRSGMFSPLAMRSTRSMAKKVAPLLASAGARVESSRIAGAATRDQARIHTQGGITRERIAQKGATGRSETAERGKTLRTNLQIAADKLLGELSSRTKLSVSDTTSAAHVNAAKISAKGGVEEADIMAKSPIHQFQQLQSMLALGGMGGGDPAAGSTYNYAPTVDEANTVPMPASTIKSKGPKATHVNFEYDPEEED